MCAVSYFIVRFITSTTTTAPSLTTWSLLPTCFWLKAWVEPLSPQIRQRPRKVGVALPTMGLSNEGRPADRAMEPSNQEVSGEERNPSRLKRWKANPTEGNLSSFHKSRNKCVSTLSRARKQQLSQLKSELSNLSLTSKSW